MKTYFFLQERTKTNKQVLTMKKMHLCTGEDKRSAAQADVCFLHPQTFEGRGDTLATDAPKEKDDY